MQDVEEVAKAAGFHPLRPAQARALKRVAEGQNLLVIWPTGSGKSLCYQLPAQVNPGLTLVISPLIALMDDQVAKGRAVKWPVTCVHSNLPKAEREARLRRVAEGRIKLLYVTPERFRVPEFDELIRKLRVSLLAVDEAHCISQWGHDFRPDYSRLAEIRKLLGDPQTIALTATATREVQADILKQLDLPQSTPILWEGVERPNLHLAADEFGHEDDKFAALVDWLAEHEGPKIVYCTLIGTLQSLSERLRAKGFAHGVYHGDLDGRARRESQARFLSGAGELMLATPAFGLGVDKPDIRAVAHYEIPGSIEAYFQEVGRAGRDGEKSRCRLFYRQDDLETQMRFIESLTPDPDFVRATYNLLVSWRERLPGSSLDDLRAQLSFKNKRDFRLETAMSYLDRWGVIHYPQRRLDKLEFLRELEDGDLNAELWKARKLSLQKKLMALVRWFRSEECRKVGIYRYFGWANEEPCGFCDRCEGG